MNFQFAVERLVAKLHVVSFWGWWLLTGTTMAIINNNSVWLIVLFASLFPQRFGGMPWQTLPKDKYTCKLQIDVPFFNMFTIMKGTNQTYPCQDSVAIGQRHWKSPAFSWKVTMGTYLYADGEANASWIFNTNWDGPMGMLGRLGIRHLRKLHVLQRDYKWQMLRKIPEVLVSQQYCCLWAHAPLWLMSYTVPCHVFVCMIWFQRFSMFRLHFVRCVWRPPQISSWRLWNPWAKTKWASPTWWPVRWGCHWCWLPSGNLLHSYWKRPFIVSFPIKNGDFP